MSKELKIKIEGDKGEKGETGPQGIQGERGDKGEKGDKGDIGEKGERGISGNDGEKGEKGDKGDKGERGEKGDKGDDGSPDTPQQVKEKLLEVGLDYSEVKNTPDIPKLIQKVTTVDVPVIVRNLTRDIATKDVDWGEIKGDISNQTDLVDYLESQDTLQEITDNGSTTTNAITVGGITTPYAKFDTSATPVANAEGLLQWNSTDGTLNLGMQGGNITQQIGQELFIKVINKTGSIINNGTPVYFSGRQGNRPKIIPARSDAEATSMVMGITTEDILDNAEGYITTFGYVRQIKTNYSGTGDWGTIWAEGDKLYVSKTVAGQLTNVEPAVPHHSDIIGEVAIVGGAGIGSIFVSIDKHHTMMEMTDVDGTPLTTTGQVLVWNQTTGYWDPSSNLLTEYVPYTGATADVDLGLNSLTANEFYLQAIPLTTDASTATSIFFGYDAGSGVDVASSIFMGTNAGNGATSAFNSNFFGDSAGFVATDAYSSNFFGREAGYGATGADNSNFFGSTAGYTASNAQNSNFFGNGAGFYAENAIASNFFGYNAGLNAVYADNSNFFGTDAGVEATYAQSSNFFGNAAGFGATDAYLSNFFGISAGSGATYASGSNFFGYQAGYGATEAHSSNFFGTEAGYGATEANTDNFFGIQAGYGASGVQSSNFFGNRAGYSATYASSSNFFGISAGQDATNAYNSNFFGSVAGYAATYATYSNFFGDSAGHEASGADNSNFFGYRAGYGATDAYSSNFFGPYAGYGADTATYSNFFGTEAGHIASHAHSSNFFGYNAGYNAVYADSSNFFGASAGAGALYASNSNFYGSSAGDDATNANNAIFIGYLAGYQDIVNNGAQYPDGSFKSSIVIGDYAGTGGYSDSITIGKGTKNSAANQANIGNVLFIEGIYALKTQSSTPITTGKVGIGISPTAKLTIAAGTATAGTAPVKLTPGTCMTVAEQGAIEYCGSYFHATPNTTRKTITLAEDVVTYEDEMISNLGDLVII